MEKNKSVLPLFISKSELAMMYLPGLAPHSAVNRFMLWLEKNAELMSELLKLGYKKTQKQFNRDQIKVIFNISTSLNVTFSDIEKHRNRRAKA